MIRFINTICYFLSYSLSTICQEAGASKREKKGKKWKAFTQVTQATIYPLRSVLLALAETNQFNAGCVSIFLFWLYCGKKSAALKGAV